MIGHDHLDCGMGMMDQASHEDDEMHIDAPDCCDNDYISVEMDEQFKKSTSTESMHVFVVATVAQLLYFIDFNNSQEPIASIESSPPIIDQDFQVMHQVFLI